MAKNCELIILGVSTRKCADIIGVGVKTSFYICIGYSDVINLSLKNDKVEGIVEVDECFIKESFKGNHSKSFSNHLEYIEKEVKVKMIEHKHYQYQ